MINGVIFQWTTTTTTTTATMNEKETQSYPSLMYLNTVDMLFCLLRFFFPGVIVIIVNFGGDGGNGVDCAVIVVSFGAECC